MINHLIRRTTTMMINTRTMEIKRMMNILINMKKVFLMNQYQESTLDLDKLERELKRTLGYSRIEYYFSNLKKKR
jgi:hypothetical protein